MNRMKKLLALLLATLAALSLLTACKGGDDGAETETEAETDLPRFDYMTDNVLSRVTLDRTHYTGLTLTIPADLEITDQSVEEYIQSLRVQHRVPAGTQTTEAETEPETSAEPETTAETITETAAETDVNSATDVTETEAQTETETLPHVTDEPLRIGDSAFIYYRGEKDGVAFDGGSNMSDAKPYELILGSGAFIPGFEEGLVDVIPANTSKENPFALNVTFPEGYQNADLAGQAVVFYVVVEYAVQYDLPEVNKSFVLDTLKYKSEKKEEEYATEQELLDEFYAYARKQLETQNQSALDEAKSNALWEHLFSVVECRDLPAEELAYYKHYYESRVQSDYDYYCGMYGQYYTSMYPTVDDFAVVYMGLSKGADWRAETAKMATDLVKRDMIIHAVAELEGTETVSEAELEAEIRYYIDYYAGYNVKKTREEILAEIGEDYLCETVLKMRVDEWLRSGCTFVFGE